MTDLAKVNGIAVADIATYMGQTDPTVLGFTWPSGASVTSYGLFHFDNNLTDAKSTLTLTNAPNPNAILLSASGGKFSGQVYSNTTSFYKYAGVTPVSGFDFRQAFCIDFWAYRGTHTNNEFGRVLSLNGATTQPRFYILYSQDVSGDAAINITISTSSGTVLAATTTAQTLSQAWHHWAITYDEDKVRVFCDGTLIYTSASITKTDMPNPADYNSSSCFIPLVQGGYFQMDELRIVLGNAVWTSGFTPPSSAYTD